MNYYLPIQYFTYWVNRIPDEIAVKFEGNALTYRELDNLSSQIAAVLHKVGAAPNDRVAIWMPKSERYVAAILGIWKVGAAYVPLDYKAPPPRLEFMVRDCEPVCVLTDSLESPIREYAKTISLDEISNSHTDEHFDLSESGRKVIGSDLAYVIYTSGSTGKPKGVIINNNALLSFFNHLLRNYEHLEEQRNIINIAQFSFDQSVLDIALFLAQGKTLHVYEGAQNIFKLMLTLQNERINIISTVPTVFGMMLSTGAVIDRFDLSNLKTLVTGGAPCPPKFVTQLKNKLPWAHIYNFYGPTEATVYCISMRVDNVPLDDYNCLPLGVPFDNMDAFIVDENDVVVPQGEVGELVLRGPQLMQGYWGLDGKTSEVLKLDPRNPKSRTKVYYTGDLARVDEDGIFHFLARKDNVIKSAGHRIDLNEIDLVLHKHPGIREVAAVAAPDELLGAKLVAYFSANENEVDIESLKALCASELPEYMVPHEFVQLNELPKSSAGKIDRKAILELG